MIEYVNIITATNRRENAEKISNELVQNGLAACVQIVGPVTSTYRWKGKVEVATEWLCIAKTRKDFYRAVEAAICHSHVYEIPEVLAIPALEGNAHYISWLNEQLRKPF